MTAKISVLLAVVSAVLMIGTAQADDRPSVATGSVPQGPPPPEFTKSVTGWTYDAKTNCWALDPTSLPAASFTWTGSCTDLQISGDGTLTWYHAGLPGQVVTGKFAFGMLDGNGKMTWPDGSHYEGTFKDSLADGTGAVHWPNGGHYEGQFRYGRFEGQGHLFKVSNLDHKTASDYRGNSQYDGGFKSGKYDGQGVLAIGENRLEGEFSGGTLAKGHAHFVSPDGSRFDGDVRNGNPEGHGTLSFISGTYDGQFHLGNMSGPGRLRLPDGTILEGIAEPAREDSNPPVQITYPPVSRRLSEEGDVIITYIVRADGQVTDIKVFTSSGYERLDKAAADAVAAMHFVPARMAGTAIVIEKDRAFRYHLE